MIASSLERVLQNDLTKFRAHAFEDRKKNDNNKYQNRKREAKTKRQMNTNESLIMNSEHQPLVLFSVVNQVMLKSYPT